MPPFLCPAAGPASAFLEWEKYEVAFAHYVAGGVLQYEELLLAVAVHRGAQVRCSIPRIWVTSESAQHGGRELWGIPKHLGDFSRSADGPDARITSLPFSIPTEPLKRPCTVSYLNM